MSNEDETTQGGWCHELNLKSISCNTGGKYEARLELKASEGTFDLTEVKVERSGEVVDSTGGLGLPPLKFEVTEENLGEQIPLNDGNLKFYFPKDLSSPAAEVYLFFELRRYPLQTTDEDQSLSSGVQPPPSAVFNARLVLYPRSPTEEAPLPSGSINLIQRLEDESIVQLGAKIWYEEQVTPKEGKGTEEPTENSGTDGAVEESRPATAAPEEPVPREKTPMPAVLGNIVLLVHAACLPKSSKTLQCRPFVRCFVSEEGPSTSSSINGHVETPPSQNATLSPLWEHRLNVPVNENSIERASLVLQIIDYSSSSVLPEYQLPVSLLQSFHQYHLDLIQPMDEAGKVHLFVSMMYHPSKLPAVGDLTYRALEASISSIDGPITNPAGPLTIAAYLSHDWRQDQKKIDPPVIKTTAVHFPNPPSSQFETSPETGHTTSRQYQISSPSTSETHPQWTHPFLFAGQRDLSSIFTDTAALVVCLMAASSSFDGQSWSLRQQVGSAIQTLDKTVYEALIDPRGKAGVKVHALKLKSASLQGQQFGPLGLHLTLRLIIDENIESTISSSSPETLPSLDAFLPPEPEKAFKRTDTYLTKPSVPKTPLAPVRHKTPPYRNGYKRTRVPRQEDGPIPAYDAMQAILDRLGKPEDMVPTKLPAEEQQERRHSEDVPDRFSLGLIESQQRELDNYRQALQKMGEEMVGLQQMVSRLEGEKSFLQRQLNMHEDAAKALVTAENAEVITKAELLDKYVTLKQALSQQVEETTSYRDKVLALQNDLIKLNDKEQKQSLKDKQLLSQTNLLQERNEKIKKLENTCRIQETALEKMERLLKKRLNVGTLSQSKANNNNVENPLVDSLSVENATLKAQLAQMKAESSTELASNEAADELMRELQFEKATKRIASLEQEIRDKAKEWGREKTAMRLSMSADRDMNRYRTLPPLDNPYDVPHRNEDYFDRGYRSQRPPPLHSHTRHSPLF